MELPLVSNLSKKRRATMELAAFEVVDIAESLAERDRNVVSEVMKESEGFIEWQHYPKDDVRDRKTHAQYYYHSHNGAANEHGHFHTFMRAKGMPKGAEILPHSGQDTKEWPDGDDAMCHLIAVSMDHHGIPTHLFTTNRWVTGDTFYSARDTIAMLDGFAIGGDWISSDANRWIASMLVLFRPQIESLLVMRDQALAVRRSQVDDKNSDIYEDRAIELASICEISITEQLAWLELLE